MFYTDFKHLNVWRKLKRILFLLRYESWYILPFLNRLAKYLKGQTSSPKSYKKGESQKGDKNAGFSVFWYIFLLFKKNLIKCSPSFLQLICLFKIKSKGGGNSGHFHIVLTQWYIVYHYIYIIYIYNYEDELLNIGRLIWKNIRFLNTEHLAKLKKTSFLHARWNLLASHIYQNIVLGTKIILTKN